VQGVEYVRRCQGGEAGRGGASETEAALESCYALSFYSFTLLARVQACSLLTVSWTRPFAHVVWISVI
jgi:hypothetical protein